MLQQIFHGIHGFVNRLFLCRMIKVGVVVGSLDDRVRVRIRRVHGVAGDKYSRQQRDRYR